MDLSVSYNVRVLEKAPRTSTHCLLLGKSLGLLDTAELLGTVFTFTLLLTRSFLLGCQANLIYESGGA